ncbi:MAG: DLW-39 family protein [Actinomycetes bacterium]
MKKLLLAVAAVAGGLVGYRKLTAAKADQALWSEATDNPSTPASPATGA